MAERETTLNAVLYLASLASDYHRIDTLLDKVRDVTVLLGPRRTPNLQEEAELVAVRRKLEDYLIHQEQLRVFSKETLDQKVREHFEHGNGRLRWRLLGIVALIIALTAATSALAPVSAPDVKGMLTVCTFNSLLSLSAAFLFFRSLGSFVPSVRAAFHNIGIGFVLIALSQIALPAPILLFTPGSVGFQAIGIFVSVVILLSLGFLYIGIRQYARHTHIVSRLLNNTYIGISIAFATVASVALLAFSAHGGGLVTNVNVVLQSWMVVLGFIVTVLIAKVAKQVSAIYSKAARVLMQALVLMAIVSTYFYVYLLYLAFTGLTTAQALLIPGSILGSVSCIFNLYAGYTFYRSSKY